ncbi:MAG: hypothetical protein H6713_20950 [Myxococcales bacterium]|nr:hypothetical protein [Myxococcales bacterium]
MRTTSPRSSTHLVTRFVTRRFAARLALPLALALAPACASTRAPEDSANQQTADEPTPAPVDAPKAAPEPEAPKDTRVLAESGLGVGGELRPFEVVDAVSGERSCQLCELGPSPRIVAVGTLEDAAFHDDLQNLDAIVKKYGDARLKAFGVITEIRDGRSITPIKQREELMERVKTLRAKLRVDIPIVVPATQDEGPNKAFDDYYNITRSRTLMLADGENTVKFSAVAPPDLFALNQSILELVDDAPATDALATDDDDG